VPSLTDGRTEGHESALARLPVAAQLENKAWRVACGHGVARTVSEP
jgi:hypothetical protein